MRIAYVCYWDAFLLDGVTKKISGQSEYWQQAGHEVEVFCLTPKAQPPRPPALPASLFTFESLRDRYAKTRRLAAAVRSFRPDVTYMRYDTFLPPIAQALRVAPVVLELNEQPSKHRILPTLARRYALWNRRRLLARASGFVTVSNETAGAPWLKACPQPTLVLGNSLDLSTFPITAEPENERPRGIFVGGARMPWHGVDKIRALAERLPTVDFDVIGPTDRDLRGTAPENLRMHGFLERAEYEPLVRESDFGIGTLALHRVGLNENAALKLREYLAFGLPVMLANDDPDLTPEPHWFVCKLPNSESNVVDSSETIQAWIEEIRGRRVPRPIVERLIGAETKETARLAFMHGVTSAPPRSP